MLISHPAFPLLLGAIFVALSKGKLRSLSLLLFPMISVWSAFQATTGTASLLPLFGYELVIFKVDFLSRFFGWIFAIAGFLGVLYSLHQKNVRESLAAILHVAGGLGLVYAGDWLSFFVFWELMSLASFWLIWENRTPAAKAAGWRYFYVHVTGGGLLFAGVLMKILETETIHSFGPLGILDLSSILILLGVIINAAVPPFHAWLTDAYPEASPGGSVILTAFTTKGAVYILIRLFPGTEILIGLGVFMALYGVVFAVLENDIRRLLGYHIISQVGYMVAGVGMGTAMSLNGASAHAFCHILYKALLFMGAGAVLYSTGKSKLTELGNLASKMKWVFFLYMIGAFSISGFPFFNGFVSKSMVVDAAHQGHFLRTEALLWLASIGTFLHTGLKLPYWTFLGEKRDYKQLRPVPWNMILAMALTALLCFGIGVYPTWMYSGLPYPVHYEPYTLHHVLGAYLLLAGTFLSFWWMRGMLGGQNTITVDTDWFYRKTVPPVTRLTVSGLKTLGAFTKDWGEQTSQKIYRAISSPYRPWNLMGFSVHPEKPFHYPIGATVTWILLLFVIATATLFFS